MEIAEKTMMFLIMYVLGKTIMFLLITYVFVCFSINCSSLL